MLLDAHLDVTSKLPHTSSCPSLWTWLENAFLEASREGWLSILRWMSASTPIDFYRHIVWANAAAAGHLHILRWFYQQYPSFFYEESGTWYVPKAARFAAERGDVDMLRWLHTIVPSVHWHWQIWEAAAQAEDMTIFAILARSTASV